MTLLPKLSRFDCGCQRPRATTSHLLSKRANTTRTCCSMRSTCRRPVIGCRSPRRLALFADRRYRAGEGELTGEHTAAAGRCNQIPPYLPQGSTFMSITGEGQIAPFCSCRRYRSWLSLGRVFGRSQPSPTNVSSFPPSLLTAVMRPCQQCGQDVLVHWTREEGGGRCQSSARVLLAARLIVSK